MTMAAHYQPPLEAVLLASRLEQGDALVLGQALRIPRVSGFPHVVAAGETARLCLTYEASLAFLPDRIDAGRGLTAGSEIFIPSPRLQLPAARLRAVDGMEVLALQGPAPAALVVAGQANL
ncbi:MAG: hypothetical protein ACUVS4_11435 [Chloroflexaceae bacterium]